MTLCVLFLKMHDFKISPDALNAIQSKIQEVI